MKFKHKEKGYECEGSNFNMHSISEIIMYGDDDMWTDSPAEYDVFIEATQEWMDYYEARKQNLIINDNYNTRIFEPETEEDKIRGYTLN
jgi:hypothetical protein